MNREKEKIKNYAATFFSLAKDREIEATCEMFTKFLSRRGETHLFKKIFQFIEEELSRGDDTIVVSSRYAISASTRARLSVFLRERSGEVVFEENEKMFGGIKIRHKDYTYDASADAVLAELRATWRN